MSGSHTRVPRYVVIEHPSDVGFELQSASREMLFEDAVLTYYDMLVGMERIDDREARTVEVEGSDDGDLMVALLSQCVYMTEVDQMVFCEAHIELLDGFRIRMRLWGEPVDAERHPFELGVKAVTYHDLQVARQPDGTWRARVVFDI